jgi:hypothetical protein
MNNKHALFAACLMMISTTAVSAWVAPADAKGTAGTNLPGPSKSFTVPANYLAPGVCPFDVQVDLDGKVQPIPLPGNRFIITSSGLNVTLTNLSDPTKTVTLNISGSVYSSVQNGNTVTVATNRNLVADPVAGLSLAIGTYSIVFDAAGNLVQPFTGQGTLANVCQLIS